VLFRSQSGQVPEFLFGSASAWQALQYEPAGYLQMTTNANNSAGNSAFMIIDNPVTANFWDVYATYDGISAKNWSRSLIISWIDTENYLCVRMGDYSATLSSVIGGIMTNIGSFNVGGTSGGGTVNHSFPTSVVAQLRFSHGGSSAINRCVWFFTDGYRATNSIPLRAEDIIFTDNSSPRKVGWGTPRRDHLYGFAVRGIS